MRLDFSAVDDVDAFREGFTIVFKFCSNLDHLAGMSDIPLTVGGNTY